MRAILATRTSDDSTMQRLIFASHNPHKIKEIRAILGPDFYFSGLDELGFHGDIPEPYDSLEENALAKARFVADRFFCDCFADDTGLEVEALGGLPGVQSARYAGPKKDSRANRQKLLAAMEGMEERQASFRTVIALVMGGREYLFEGRVRGHISREARGEKGFGYDPVFVPEGYRESFAEMEEAEKNKISHRKRAIDGLLHFLQARSGSP